MNGRPRYSIVAPIYNEEGNIALLFERIQKVMESTGETWELLLVNDGSFDRSPEMIDELAQRDPHVKAIHFARNFGHQTAVTAGIDYASGDAVVLIDADLQDPPELILEMIERWKAGFQVVYAVRAERKGESRFKLLTAKLFYRVIYRITDVDIPVDTGDFRLMDRKVVEALKAMREHNRFIRGHDELGRLQADAGQLHPRSAALWRDEVPAQKDGALRARRDHRVFVFSAANHGLR